MGEMERERMEDKMREEERMKRNRKAEEERLRREKERAVEEAEYKREAAQHMILEQKAENEEAQMTMAEKAAEKRLANWRAIIANNQAKAKENMLAKEIADGSKESLSSSLDSSAGRTSQKHVEKGKNADVVGSEIRPDAQPMLRGKGDAVTGLGRGRRLRRGGKGRKTLRRWLREWRGRGDHQCWICIARLWREGEAIVERWALRCNCERVHC